jgi:hypothetical protein
MKKSGQRLPPAQVEIVSRHPSIASRLHRVVYSRYRDGIYSRICLAINVSTTPNATLTSGQGRRKVGGIHG